MIGDSLEFSRYGIDAETLDRQRTQIELDNSRTDMLEYGCYWTREAGWAKRPPEEDKNVHNSNK